MYVAWGTPFHGHQLQKILQFLEREQIYYNDLENRPPSKTTEEVALFDESGEPVAFGCLESNILKRIVVAGGSRGEGLASIVATHLIQKAFTLGHSHLFLFTKPCNAGIFYNLGFYPVGGTSDVFLMENRKHGFADYILSVHQASFSGKIGAIIANCDPFTNGHLHLANYAAAHADFVYMFILAEEKGFIPAAERLSLARAATSGIGNLFVCSTGPYLVSSVTFPDYFLKDRAQKTAVFCDLDIALFCDRFAKELDITTRFVGTEPYCQTTAQYNERMKLILPQQGIDLVELPRLEQDGSVVSASTVRSLMKQGQVDAAQALVPPSVFRRLKELFSP